MLCPSKSGFNWALYKHSNLSNPHSKPRSGYTPHPQWIIGIWLWTIDRSTHSGLQPHTLQPCTPLMNIILFTVRVDNCPATFRHSAKIGVNNFFLVVKNLIPKSGQKVVKSCQTLVRQKSTVHKDRNLSSAHSKSQNLPMTPHETWKFEQKVEICWSP